LNQLTHIQIGWAFQNIIKDESEEVDKITHIIDILKPWLNFKLAQAEKENKSKKEYFSEGFKQQLLSKGASLDEIKGMEQTFEKKPINIDSLESEIEREINGR